MAIRAKIYLEDEIRAYKIENFDDLVESVTFLGVQGLIQFKYLDEDNDWVNLDSEYEFQEAALHAKPRLHIKVTAVTRRKAYTKKFSGKSKQGKFWAPLELNVFNPNHFAFARCHNRERPQTARRPFLRRRSHCLVAEPKNTCNLAREARRKARIEQSEAMHRDIKRKRQQAMKCKKRYHRAQKMKRRAEKRAYKKAQKDLLVNAIVGAFNEKQQKQDERVENVANAVANSVSSMGPISNMFNFLGAMETPAQQQAKEQKQKEKIKTLKEKASKSNERVQKIKRLQREAELVWDSVFGDFDADKATSQEKIPAPQEAVKNVESAEKVENVKKAEKVEKIEIPAAPDSESFSFPDPQDFDHDFDDEFDGFEAFEPFETFDIDENSILEESISSQEALPELDAPVKGEVKEEVNEEIKEEIKDEVKKEVVHEPVKAPEQTPEDERVNEIVLMIQEMGFKDVDLIRHLVKHLKGDVEKVVNQLIMLQSF